MLSQAIGLPVEEVEKAIRDIVPAKALDVNLEAFREGRQLLN
jgi:indolepyruvate ferredoxin oxidoreductase beta subunit